MSSIYAVASGDCIDHLLMPLWRCMAAERWIDGLLVRAGDSEHVVWQGEMGQFPDRVIDLAGMSAGERTAAVMTTVEALCSEARPVLVIVAGGDLVAMAAAIAAKKLQLPVVHLDSGRRYGARLAPGNVERAVTDSMCDQLWTLSGQCVRNLQSEGIASERIVSLSEDDVLDATAVGRALASLRAMHEPGSEMLGDRS